MSWGFTLTKVPAVDVCAQIDAAQLGDGFSSDFARDEAQAQLDASKVAAKAIFTSGCVGTEGEYNISLSGHAEPGHERRPGYSGDMVYVQVQRYIDYSAS